MITITCVYLRIRSFFIWLFSSMHKVWSKSVEKDNYTTSIIISFPSEATIFIQRERFSDIHFSES